MTDIDHGLPRRGGTLAHRHLPTNANPVNNFPNAETMQTIFDWITMAVFGGLVVLFLQRSAGPEDRHDKMYHYVPPALGCAAANYLGNNGQQTVAIVIILAVVGYILFVLHPFGDR